MADKIIVLIFSTLLCQLSMASDLTPEMFASTKDLGKCLSTCNKYPITIGSKMYHIETTLKVNWFEAVNNCRKWGGHLLNIESSMEMDVITAIAGSDRFWTSSNCLAGDDDFISIATGVAMPYSRWNAGQPEKKPDGFCVGVNKGGLNTENCEALQNYVCQAVIYR